MSVAQFDIVRDEVAVTANAFLAEFTAWAGDLRRVKSLNEMRAGLTEVLTAMSSVAASERVAAFETAFQGLFADAERFARAQPPGSVWTVRDVDLAPLWVTLDEALADFDDEELGAARSACASATARIQQLRARLSRAVEAADVAAVRELRDEVELVAPGELVEAEARVRALEVRRAQAVADRAKQRYAPVAAAQQQALRRVEDLAAALADAERALRAEQALTVVPSRAATIAGQRLAAAERTAKEQAAAAAAARRAQVLQLAGIGSGTTADVTSIAARNRHFEAELIQQTRQADDVVA